MTPRTWWIGIAVIVAALVAHAFLPRYEVRSLDTRAGVAFYVRVDRWTGRSALERLDHSTLTRR